MSRSAYIIALIFFAALILLFALQNLGDVSLKLLGLRIEGPFFIIILFFIGTGILLIWLFRKATGKPNHKQLNENDSQSEKRLIINTVNAKSNGTGTAGFILALIALFLLWVPILGQILWLLGLIFSLVGIFKTPKGFAIAGLVISLIKVIVLIIVFGGLFAALSTI